MFSTLKNRSSFLNTCVFIAVIGWGLALYLLPVHTAAFHFDDTISIVGNKFIRTIDIPSIFNAFNTRFLVGLSFALNYKFGGLDPFAFRLTNLFIHCINAFLVFLLVKSTLYLYQARKAVFSLPLEWPAFFASMLFLCHPLQTEPVNFITQRFVLMGSFFYLLTMVLYIQFRIKNKGSFYFIAAMFSAVAAMFCKEFVVTLPVMLAVYDFYFLGSTKETIGDRTRHLIPFFIVALIVPLLLLRTPPQVIGVANIAESRLIQDAALQKKINRVDITRANGSMSRKQYFLTELNVLCTYLRLLFVPINQNVDYDYPATLGMDFKTVLCAGFLLCLLGAAFFTFNSSRIISFSILWFFIALSVESSFIPIGHVIAEYRVYLASVGFAFGVMNLIYTLKVDRKLLMAVFTTVLAGYSILTFQRNKIWKDEYTLWNDTAGKSPHKARAYYNRGVFEDQHMDFIHAVADYNKAIDIDPNDADALTNRGVIYAKQGHMTQALIDITKAIRINPGSEVEYTDWGIISSIRGDYLLAISKFVRALAINPDYAKAYWNRAIAYFHLGKYEMAWADLDKAKALGFVAEQGFVSDLKKASAGFSKR